MKKVDFDSVHRILENEVKHYDVPIVDLIKIQTQDPFKVLVTTILSARTNDRTTAAASKRLFEKAFDLQSLEKLTVREIERLIFPVGFYKNKARYLTQLPLVLREKFGGKIPQTIEELVQLPGVGRKTANLVVVIAFEKPGVCVDIHVHRIMNRLGYVKTKTPFKTEMALRKKLPEKYWISFNSILVAFGQNLCRPQSPFCSKCPVFHYCNRVGVVQSR
ncbi:MAG: endonuclease III [Candidatus Diapherotrites archaeon]|uniref:Endonuclease III n=1 Tax=Candidatus Iainarchaeum sp. TaxID=3101447 RepID=A0A8T4L7L9_9ARCH|nr:endonuclease III [Candidatus Diapherotrites archaeon]